MNLLIVDDSASLLLCFELVFRNTGHHVKLFSDPASALASLAPDTDLVISDINMPGMDGFAVAGEVVSRLGSALPRTLLMSENHDYRSTVQTLPPSTVIGLMTKPFGFTTLRQAVGLFQKTRSCCPGQLLSGVGVPPAACEGSGRQATGEACLCLTARYGLCPRYNSGCGLRFREHLDALQVRNECGSTNSVVEA